MEKEKVSVAIGKEKYRTEITMRQHELIADEPEDLGGKDKGPIATEILLSSLGTCTAITLRMYADRKEWPLEGVEVELTMKQEKEGSSLATNMERKIHLKGDLTEDQKDRLLSIANKCPVHKTLTSPISIESSLV